MVAMVKLPEDSRPVRPMTLPRSSARSAITNQDHLPGVDGRSSWARRMRDLMALHIADLGGEYNSTVDHGRAVFVALPVPKVGGVMVTYSRLPELPGQLGIVHRQVVQAALFASLGGALAGLLVAMLIAGRLRRIAHAADAIERGNFDTRLHPWLKDELGGLAETIDRMRGRLRKLASSPRGRRLATICSSMWARNTPVRLPTCCACRK